MKKLSLKDFKNGLKREEMKEVLAGYPTYFGCHSASFHLTDGGWSCIWYGGQWILSHP